MSPIQVTVLGAGVVGLTTALLLSRDSRFKVTLVAKHMPGDYDILYASPWAGANYFPVGKPGTNLAQFERATWPELARLATETLEAGVHFQDSIVYRRDKDQGSSVGDWTSELTSSDPWFKDVVPDFRLLPKSEIPPSTNADSATAFTSVCINTAIYLPWLLGQCLANGATVRRGVVSHVAEAATLKPQHVSPSDGPGKRADLVINCTGLGARTLGGVMDKKMYPARGQIVLVRNDPGVMVTVSGTDDGEDEATYVMARAGGGGTVLGGCLQAHSAESQPDANLSMRIMRRSVELCPTLVPQGAGVEGLDIIRHGVGVRPMREGGPRVERQDVDGVRVVHQYGHGGYGYQASYGSAYRAMELVEEIVKEIEAAA